MMSPTKKFESEEEEGGALHAEEDDGAPTLKKRTAGAAGSVDSSSPEEDDGAPTFKKQRTAGAAGSVDGSSPSAVAVSDGTQLFSYPSVDQARASLLIHKDEAQLFIPQLDITQKVDQGHRHKLSLAFAKLKGDIDKFTEQFDRISICTKKLASVIFDDTTEGAANALCSASSAAPPPRRSLKSNSAASP